MLCVGTFLTPLLVCIVTGSKMDQSATDIYLEDICGMVAAYSKEGSPEAADRKLSILFGKIICGRAAEAAWTTFEGMQSDKFHAKDFAEVPQIKTSKPKYTALPPGKDMHSDVYLAFADKFSLGGYGVQEGVPWLIPGMRGVQDPATKLGSFMKVCYVWVFRLYLPLSVCIRACVRKRCTASVCVCVCARARV
jgi:hypothetical protein